MELYEYHNTVRRLLNIHCAPVERGMTGLFSQTKKQEVQTKDG